MQDQWYRRAQLALDKGEEELARDALRRKKSFSDTAAMLKKQLDHHTRATSQLTTNIRCCHMPFVLMMVSLSLACLRFPLASGTAWASP